MNAIRHAFLIDVAIACDREQIRALGGAVEGEIKLGDRFNVAFEEPFEWVGSEWHSVGRTNVRQINLRVQRIIAYERDLDILSHGMSGELHLKGDGGALLQQGDTIAEVITPEQ